LSDEGKLCNFGEFKDLILLLKLVKIDGFFLIDNSDLSNSPPLKTTRMVDLPSSIELG